MPTTARGIWTPSDTDAVDFTTHLATMAGTIDTAITNGLNTVGAGANAHKGTAAQRTAFLSTAVNGMLWQDTDGIKMIWRKDGAVWVPAVWRWSGTTAQMTAFTQAPNGFEWFNTTDNSDYVRLSGAWVGSNAYGEARRTSTALTIPNGSYGNLSASSAWTRSMSGGVTWDTDGFVVPTTARYTVWWTLQISAAVSGNSGLAGVKRTSKSVAGENMIALSPIVFGGAAAGNGSADITLTAGDKLQLYGFSLGSTLTVSNVAGADASSWGVRKH